MYYISGIDRQECLSCDSS